MSKFYRSCRDVACAVLTLAVGIGVLVAGTGPTAYRIEDLGTFGGPEECEAGVFPTWSESTALNESGNVAGWAEDSEWLLDPDTGEPLVYPDTGDAVCRLSSYPAQWRYGEIIDLGALEEGGHAFPLGMNDHDHVVGRASAGGRFHPFLWIEGDGMADLFPHDPGSRGEARDINNFGEIVIQADEAYFRDAQGGLHPIRFPDAPSLPADAFAINDDGLVVGYQWRDGASPPQVHAFRYDSRADAIEDIHDPFYIQSFGYGLNEAGDIAVIYYAYTWHGFSSVSTGEGDLVVLPLGNMRYRGELRPDLLQGRPHDMNAHGDVIGYDISVAHRGAVAWIAFDVFGEGPIEKIPVNNLLSPEDRADWEVWYAWGLNDSRQIAGYASHKGKNRAFLMTPDDTVLDGDAGIQATTEAVSGGAPSRVEIETAARLEAVARVVPESLGPNRAVGMLRPRPSIEPRESDGLRNLDPASGADDGTTRISHPAPVPRSISRDGTPDDDIEPFDRNSEPTTRDDR